jgi:hypothetical protein
MGMVNSSSGFCPIPLFAALVTWQHSLLNPVVQFGMQHGWDRMNSALLDFFKK